MKVRYENSFGIPISANLNVATTGLLGNETLGVSEEIRVLADGNFNIPQQGLIRSLNISVACAVTIYEAYRQKTIAGHFLKPSLPEEKRNSLLREWGFKENDMP